MCAYVAADDPQLKKLRAAWQRVLNHFGPPKNATEEFNDWWHACSAMSSACTGGFGTYIGHGLSPNFTTEAFLEG